MFSMNRSRLFPGSLSDSQWQALKVLPFSRRADLNLVIRPASVRLRDGRHLDNVLFIDAYSFGCLFRSAGERWIASGDIVGIRPCPRQLPPRFVEEIYQRGANLADGHLFVLHMKGGRALYGLTGPVVDFLELPEGYAFGEIEGITCTPEEVDCFKSVRRFQADCRPPREVFWCVYHPLDPEQYSVIDVSRMFEGAVQGPHSLACPSPPFRRADLD